MSDISMERLREIQDENCHRIGQGHLIATESTMEGWEMARELRRLRLVIVEGDPEAMRVERVRIRALIDAQAEASHD